MWEQSEPKEQRKYLNTLDWASLPTVVLTNFPEVSNRQRVAVARAVASNPKLVLADEPTANLDGENAEKLLTMMRRLNEQQNITFVFSTHDQRVVAHARRVVTLVDGRVAKDQTKSPASPSDNQLGQGKE